MKGQIRHQIEKALASAPTPAGAVTRQLSKLGYAESIIRLLPRCKERIMKMHTTAIRFAVTANDGVIVRVGKAYMPHPKVGCDGDRVRWFDDRKLLRKQRTENDRATV